MVEADDHRVSVITKEELTMAKPPTVLKFKIGDRVYYKDVGEHDTGTVIDIINEKTPFVVKWDQKSRRDD